MLQWKISTSCGFHVMLLHKLLDLPFHSSFVLLHSAAVHLPGTGFWFGKTPRRTHAGAQPGKRGAQRCSQLLILSLPLPGAGDRPMAPLHHSVPQQHLQPTPQVACTPSAYRKPKSLTLRLTLFLPLLHWIIADQRAVTLQWNLLVQQVLGVMSVRPSYNTLASGAKVLPRQLYDQKYINASHRHCLPQNQMLDTAKPPKDWGHELNSYPTNGC